MKTIFYHNYFFITLAKVISLSLLLIFTCSFKTPEIPMFEVIEVSKDNVSYREYKKLTKKKPKVGGFIPERSRIKIKQGGKLGLRTPAGDTLYFYKETYVTLSSLKGDSKNRNLELSIYKGQVKCKVTKLNSKNSSFTVKTPVAVVGVRGTEFTTFVQLDGSTYVNVDTGEVVVSDVGGQFPSSSVNAGERTKVKPGQTTQPAVKSSWKKSSSSTNQKNTSKQNKNKKVSQEEINSTSSDNKNEESEDNKNEESEDNKNEGTEDNSDTTRNGDNPEVNKENEEIQDNYPDDPFEEQGSELEPDQDFDPPEPDDLVPPTDDFIPPEIIEESSTESFDILFDIKK